MHAVASRKYLIDLLSDFWNFFKFMCNLHIDQQFLFFSSEMYFRTDPMHISSDW